MAASQSHGIFAPRKSFVADAALAARTAVKLSATQGNVAQATAVTDPAIGIVTRACAAADIVDVTLFAPAVQVLASAAATAITVGSPLKPIASGQFGKQTATASAYVAIALEALASGTGYIEAIMLPGTTANS